MPVTKASGDPRFVETIYTKTMVDFGSMIRAVRTSSGLTQTDVAQGAGSSLGAIWKAERNLGTVGLLERIVDALDVQFAGLPPGRTIAERLKTARTRRGLTQNQLAERAGVSPMAILRLERGNARIRDSRGRCGSFAPKIRIARTATLASDS